MPAQVTINQILLSNCCHKPFSDVIEASLNKGSGILVFRMVSCYEVTSIKRANVHKYHIVCISKQLLGVSYVGGCSG